MTDIKTADNQPKGKRKHRSPNYPAISLKRSLELATIQYREDMLHQIPVDLTFKRWGYKKDQGSLYLAAVKSFGLVGVEGLGKDRQVRVTDVARRIILDSDDSSDLLKQAALKPKVYSDIWMKYNGELPRDDVLAHYLILDLNFNEKSVVGFISQFRETIAFTKLESSHILTPDDKDTEDDADSNGGENPPSIETPSEKKLVIQRQKMQQQSGLNDYKVPLSGGDATLFVPKIMSDDDFTDLKAFIDILQRRYAARQLQKANEPEQD